MASLDYLSINRYWNQAEPSMLGPYMMDGFGFPDRAGLFRFDAEKRIVDRLISRQAPTGRVLDLGCGIGHWAEHFSERFSEVVAVEGSQRFYESLKTRTATKKNINAVHCDVLDYTPNGTFDLIFLGGLLMYLNTADAITLLQRLKLRLNPDGIILCRESTIREGRETRQGDYQAVYRSKKLYSELFHQSGLTTEGIELNVPYVLMQLGCEIMNYWKSETTTQGRTLNVAGHTVYGALRLCRPWITSLPETLGFDFPRLKNHFFLLSQKPTNFPAAVQNPSLPTSPIVA